MFKIHVQNIYMCTCFNFTRKLVHALSHLHSSTDFLDNFPERIAKVSSTGTVQEKVYSKVCVKQNICPDMCRVKSLMVRLN